jgi:hypothetical protein
MPWIHRPSPRRKSNSVAASWSHNGRYGQGGRYRVLLLAESDEYFQARKKTAEATHGSAARDRILMPLDARVRPPPP